MSIFTILKSGQSKQASVSCHIYIPGKWRVTDCLLIVPKFSDKLLWILIKIYSLAVFWSYTFFNQVYGFGFWLALLLWSKKSPSFKCRLGLFLNIQQFACSLCTCMIFFSMHSGFFLSKNIYVRLIGLYNFPLIMRTCIVDLSRVYLTFHTIINVQAPVSQLPWKNKSV